MLGKTGALPANDDFYNLAVSGNDYQSRLDLFRRFYFSRITLLSRSPAFACVAKGHPLIRETPIDSTTINSYDCSEIIFGGAHAKNCWAIDFISC